MKAKLEVTLTAPMPVAQSLWTYATNDYFQHTLVELKYQSLVIKARKFSGDLAANIRIGNEEPNHLGWRHARSQVKVNSTIDVEISGTDTMRIFLDGEEATLPVWYACRITDLFTEPPVKRHIVFFNIVGGTSCISLGDSQQDDVDLAIHFSPIDNRPRKYRFNIKSWDELGLTEVR